MYKVILRFLCCHALTYANGDCFHLLVPPLAQFLCNNSYISDYGKRNWPTQMAKLDVATVFYKNCVPYRPFEHINRSITFEPELLLLFNLGQQLIHCLPLCFKIEMHLRTECKLSASREVIFQRFQLTNTFSNHKLIPKWKLDVAWQTQLASFPAN